MQSPKAATSAEAATAAAATQSSQSQLYAAPAAIVVHYRHPAEASACAAPVSTVPQLSLCSAFAEGEQPPRTHTQPLCAALPYV